MQFPEEREVGVPPIPKHVREENSGLSWAEQDFFFNLDRADGRSKTECDGNFGGRLKGLGLPDSGPKLTVIGVEVAGDGGDFVVGKKLVPAAAPHVVVAGIHRQTCRGDARVVPKQVGIVRFVSDLPDLRAGFRQNDQPQKSVFQNNGAEAAITPVRRQAKFRHLWLPFELSFTPEWPT